MSDAETILRSIREHIEHDAWQEVPALLSELYPGDLADLIETLPPELHQKTFNLIETDAKPDVLAELEGRASTDVLAALSNDVLADIVEEMAPDDAADVLADLSDERSEQVLGLMEAEESEEVRELLKYDEESAGGIMTTDRVALLGSLTIKEVIDTIQHTDEDEPFYYAYVVDENNKLMGYIGLWELLKLKDRTKTLGEMAHHHVVSATVDMDQERVGHLMSKYDLSALPVVDTQQRLVGRITWDDVMDVMEDEASEDLFLFAGSDDAELDYASPLQACKVRLPWLLITLGAGFITSTILKRFMLDLSQVFALSFFVPIVLAMGGNTGIQSSTLIIRGLAVGALEGRGITKLLGRELAAGAIMGVFCGLIMGIWAHILISFSPGQGTEFSPLYLAFTVGLALFAAMSFAAIFGAFVPIVLNRAEIDPAVASGPFVTASNDILALLIYYGVAIALIGLYGQVGGALS